MSINSEKHKLGWEAITDNFGLLKLPNAYRSVYIIDGQHRLLGFAGTEKANEVTIPVIAFENLSGPLQTKYFVDINSNQRKVTPVQLKLLGAQLHWDSDDPVQRLQALVSKLVLILAERKASPFNGKIKQLHGGAKCPLTHNELDLGFRRQKIIGRAISKENRIEGGILWSYSENEMTSTLERAYDFYSIAFNHVRKVCNENWELGKEPGGFVLMNQCVVSLIQIMSELIEYAQTKEGKDFSDYEPEKIFDEIRDYLDSVLHRLNELHEADTLLDWRLQRGASGRDEVVWRMRDIINKKHSDFTRDGLDKWRADTADSWDEEGSELFRELEREIALHILESLKNDFD